MARLASRIGRGYMAAIAALVLVVASTLIAFQIARHESRLHNVRVSLESNGRAIGGLHFSIHGLLDVQPAREPISFDAMLQPSTLQYSVSRLRRAAVAA